MRTLEHVLGVILFCAVFMLGKALVEYRLNLARTLLPLSKAPEPLSKFFLYSGRVIETVSAIAGFVEMVAVMVLVF